jgi:hypothetical protein
VTQAVSTFFIGEIELTRSVPRRHQRVAQQMIELVKQIARHAA